MADERILKIRTWLMAGDRPALVLCTDAKGKETRVSFRKGDTWMSFAKTVHALDPVKVESYDAENQLLKADTLREIESQLEPPPLSAQSTETDSTGAAVTVINPLQMITRMSELLERAYFQSNKVAWETAFGKMAEIVEIFAERAERMEERTARLENMVNRTVSEAVSAADAQNEGGLLGQLLGAYAQGQMMAKTQPPTAPPNGKGKQI